MNKIPGYQYGNSSLEKSPVSIDDLGLLKKTLLWTDEDDRYLKMAGEILTAQTEQILDVWYGYVGSHPHLLHYFTSNGEANTEYLAAVRLRFGKWIDDLCSKPHDQDWLNYQHEIARRHHHGKNETDNVNSVPIIHFRYLVAFIFPITVTIRGFLESKGHSKNDVDGMYNAWFKAVTLSTILWCHPYIGEKEF